MQHLGNSLNNNSKTHKNPDSKEQSKLRFKKETTDKLYYLRHENKTTNTHYIQKPTKKKHVHSG